MKQKSTFLKVLMTLMLLLGVSSVWAESITALFDLTKEQTNPTTIKGVKFSWATTNNALTFNNDKSSGFKAGSSLQVTIPENTKLTKIETKNGSTWGAATVEVFAGTSTSGTKIGEFVKSGTTEMFVTKNNTGSEYYFSNTTTKNAWIQSVSITYETIIPSRELLSIEVSGTPVKTTYYAGETFDHTGLKVMGKYDTGDDTEITNGITWSFDPEILSLGTTSVSVTAKVGEFESEPFNVNVTVTEKPALPSYTLVTDASTLMDGDVIVLGAVKDDKWYANGGITDKYLDAVDATCKNGILESSEAVGITLIAVDGGWNLKIGDKYINTTAAKALTFADDASTVWTISINENVATVSAGDYGRFLYNYNNGSPRFLNYTSATSAIMLLPQIFKKKNTQTVEITSAGWATACIPFDATVSGDVTAYYVTVKDGKQLIQTPIKEDEHIAAETGILLKSNSGNETKAVFTQVALDEDKVGDAWYDNMLIGTTKEEGEDFEESGYTYYILSDGENGVGFYWDGENYDEFEGAGAHCNQYKAVLAVQTGAGAPSFFTFDDATAINGISTVKASGVRYNLNGQAVSEDYKGIVIVNGKKMFNK